MVSFVDEPKFISWVSFEIETFEAFIQWNQMKNNYFFANEEIRKRTNVGVRTFAHPMKITLPMEKCFPSEMTKHYDKADAALHQK